METQIEVEYCKKCHMPIGRCECQTLNKSWNEPIQLSATKGLNDLEIL